MREQVWFAAKRGEERKYASTRPPSDEWRASLEREGYTVFRVEFEMPADWDRSDVLGAVTPLFTIQKK